MRQDARHHVTPARVAVVAGVVVLAATVVTATLATPDREPSPTGSRTAAPVTDPSSIAFGDARTDPVPDDADADPVRSWWRRTLPVAGDVTTADGHAVGRVVVSATDGATVTVLIVDLRPPTGWSGSAVLVGPGGAEHVLGPLSAEASGVSFVLNAADADTLPDPTRSLELRSDDGETTATALLLPV